MALQEIEQSGFALKINEYGETKRQYHDTNRDRFMREAKKLIIDHLDNHCGQNKDEVKNTQFHIYTY